MINILRIVKLNISDKLFGEIFKGSVFVFFTKIIAVSLGLISNLLIARNYGAEVVGIISLITSFLAVMGLFSTAGMNTSLLRLIPEQIQKYSLYEAKYIYIKIVKLTMILGGIVSLISLVAIHYGIFNELWGAEMAYWLGWATCIIVFANLAAINSIAIRALKKVKMFALLQVVQPTINLSLLILVILLTNNPDTPIYAMLLSFLFSFSVSLFLVSTVFPKKTNQPKIVKEYDSKSILSLSFPMFLSGSVWLVMSHTDTIMIGTFLGPEDVGVYAIVVKVALLSSFVLTSINSVLAPKIAEVYYGGREKDLIKIARKSSKLIFYSTSPILLFIILLGHEILDGFGSEFNVGYYPLVLLALGQFINSICGSVGYFMNMTGHQKTFNKIVLFSGALNIALNYLLIPLYGLIGAALASLIANTAWNVSSLIFIKKKFGFYMGYLPKFS
ncbi:flippase [Thalassotalea mangrovi]|uniref:flippase n=1 Tax=Thalassotalea mangrovi TaxID=2572245 RepID=UPI00145E0F30|nr:flippase [Thalassotalea mangrovi]